MRALEPTTVAVLPMAALDRATEHDAAVRARLLQNLGRFLAGRLRRVSEVTAAALQNELELSETRVAMDTFLIACWYKAARASFWGTSARRRGAPELVRGAAMTV